MQHRRGTNGGVIIWDSNDWRAGLAAQGRFATSVTFTRKQTDLNGWQTLSNIDPFMVYGILTPGSAPTAFTNSNLLSGPIVAIQLWNSSLFFGVSSGGKVHQADMVTSTITNAGIFPHTITGTSPVGQDLLTYTHFSGGTAPANQVNSIFYSYYNNANWDVGAYVNVNSSGSGTFDDDFMSSIPATPLDITSGDGDDVNQRTAPHPLCIGSDGLLYIGSANYLHGYDGSTGSNGTFYSKILTFPKGFQIIGMRKYNNSLLIAGNYYSNVASGADGTGEALVYVWNYIDSNTTQVIPLEDPYVSALFIYRGTPTVITSGIQERNGSNKVKVITGISTTRLFDFNGQIPSQRGVIVADDIIYMNSGGKIISYGDKFNKSDVINHLSTCSTSADTATIPGFMAYNFSFSILMASGSSSGGTGSLNNFNNGYDAASMTGESYQLALPDGKKGRVKSIEVKYYSTVTANGSNGAFTLGLITNFGATNTTIISGVSSLSLPLTKKYLYTSAGLPLPNFTDIALSMSWTAATNSVTPTPSKIILEYEDLDLGSNQII